MVRTYPAPTDAVRSFAADVNEADVPRLSVIVPVYDDPGGVRRTVRSLAASGYPHRDIHVVYTPADGETEAALDELRENVSDLSVHVEAEHRTPGAARNVGLECTDGDGIFFVDANMTVEEDALWALGYLFATTDVDYLGLPVEIDGASDPSLAGWYDRHVRFRVGELMAVDRFAPTCSLAVRASVFDTGLRFNPSLRSGEDLVFGHEVDSLGFEFGFCPDASTTHPVRDSLRTVLEKGSKTGWGWREIDDQYADDHVHGRSRFVVARAWLPPFPRHVAQKCRDWDSLGSVERTGICAFAYAEELARTWGYFRATIGDAADEPPDVVREWYERTGTVHE